LIDVRLADWLAQLDHSGVVVLTLLDAQCQRRFPAVIEQREGNSSRVDEIRKQLALSDATAWEGFARIYTTL
jgi:hypothetical protein